MTTTNRSYLPQYIQFPPSSVKTDAQLETEAPTPEVITFPRENKESFSPSSETLVSRESYNNGVLPQTIYPQLITSQKGSQASLNSSEPNAKTPLLPKKKIVPTKTNFFGIFLAFISGVFFTLASGTVKYLTHIDPMELLIIRSLFQVIVTLPVAMYKRLNVLGPEGSRFLLFFQGIIGGTTLVLLFYSFRLLPLGDAATIIFSSPVFVMVLSHLWLREPCGFYRTLIVFLLVTGVVFITKPPFLFARDMEESYNIIGYICALCGTVFTALNIVIMRKCKHVDFSVVVFEFSFWSLVISTAILFIAGKPEIPQNTPMEWALVLCVGIFGLSGQILVAIALQHEDAGRVAVTRSMDIVLAYVLQVLIFSEVPDWKSVLGAGMVMLCVIGMGVEDLVHKWVHGLP